MADVLVAMSGGVDSSVAAYLLKCRGYSVRGVYLMLSPESDPTAAEHAAKLAGIPFSVRDCRKSFSDRIMRRFSDEYLAGLTPNPCVFCNESLKIPALIEEADSLGCRTVATGHYAGTAESGGRTVLRRSKNRSKDQSYMLYRVSRDALSRLVFPIGDLDKNEVRRIALEAGIPSAAAKDSQDICFIPDGDYRRFLADFAGAVPVAGDYVYSDGRILGTHSGSWGFTVGQRRGIGIAWEHHLYVTGKDTSANRVFLGPESDLYSNTLTASDTVFAFPAESPFRCECRIRYSHTGSLCTVVPAGKNTVSVMFDTPQRAVTRGQSAVFYDGDIVLGGGYID